MVAALHETMPVLLGHRFAARGWRLTSSGCRCRGQRELAKDCIDPLIGSSTLEQGTGRHGFIADDAQGRNVEAPAMTSFRFGLLLRTCPAASPSDARIVSASAMRAPEWMNLPQFVFHHEDVLGLIAVDGPR